MGERYYLVGITVMLAEALYDQGRFDEAAQMIEEPLLRRDPLCQDQVRHQGQPLLVELEG